MSDRPDSLAAARALVADLRAAGCEPTGWLVDLVDDNMIRLEPPKAIRNAPKRKRKH
jgi:hypothetical protein